MEGEGFAEGGNQRVLELWTASCVGDWLLLECLSIRECCEIRGAENCFWYVPSESVGHSLSVDRVEQTSH